MYLAIDCETGGLDPDTCSLLSVAMVIADESFNLISEREVKIKHAVYRVTPGALAVNKIDLAEHDKLGISVQLAAETVMFELCKAGCRKKLIPVAKSFAFDSKFIVPRLVPAREWSKYVSHHCFELETLAVLNGVNSLEELAKVYDIPVLGESLHTALYDARLAMQIARAAANVFRGR